MHVCQTVVAALVFERQSGMVDAQTVKDGGIQVMYMDRVTNDVVAEVVGFTEACTGIDSTTRHPD